MKALISSVEPNKAGYRIAQVEQDANIFPVADTMFWVDCSEDVIADKFWYDPTTQSINLIPEPEPEPDTTKVQPISQGAQTL